MKSYFILFFSVLNIFLFAQSPVSFQDLHTTKTSENINNKACFIENKGQIMTTDRKPNNEVKYLLALNGMNVQLRNNGFSYDTYTDKLFTGNKKNNHAIKNDMDSICRTFNRVDVEFVNAQVPFVFEAKNAKDGYLNFYTGGTPEKGITCVREFQNIICKNIYPNIDIEYYSDLRNGIPVFEYRFIVNPGGNMNDIKMKYSGADLTFISNNKIIIRVNDKIIEESIPVSYMLETNNKVNISWKEMDKDTYCLVSDKDIDSPDTIVIDPLPQLIWCTYYGGNNFDRIYGLCNDNTGNVIACGYTWSWDNIASAGAYQSSFGGSFWTAFCTKFTASGNRLWGTYIGGGNGDVAQDVEVFNDNYLLIGGQTGSETNIGTPGTFLPTNSGSGLQGFLMKLNPSGFRVWGTYFGGDSSDYISDCVIDKNGRIFITGLTNSPNGIAIPGAYQDSLGDTLDLYDCFIACFDSTGNRIWGTYFGSNTDEDPGSIGIGSDFIAVSGSFGFPVTGGCAFVTSFTKTGIFNWKSFLGGEVRQWINELAVNNYNEIFLTGTAYKDSGIVTSGCYQPVLRNLEDTYLAKFDSAGNKIWATYFGGNDVDRAYAIKTMNENVFFIGYTVSTDYIATPDASQFNFGGWQDAFIAKFDRQGNRVWASYFGGNKDEYGYAISVFDENNLYIAGQTYSDSGLATPGAFDNTIGGDKDGFIAKISLCTTNYLNATADTLNCLNDTLDLVANGAISYLWNGPQGYSSADSVNHLFPIDTLFTGQYYVVGTDPDGCRDTIVFDITVDNCMFVVNTPGSSLKCYPNPAVNYIRIKGTEAGCDLMLINNLGQTMYYNVVTGNETGIDVGNLPPGYYTLVYINKECTETVKIVKY